MLTLFHSPASRSSRVIWLLEELGAPCELKKVTIQRQDGSGGADPANPHPEGKVPALMDDGVLILELPAIFLYLTDKFPQAGIGPVVGDKLRGPYLTWLSYYGGVIEPVVNAQFAGLADNPAFRSTFRGLEEMHARLNKALNGGPYLLGEKFSAADILIGSLGQFARQMMPPGTVVDDYLKRIASRPAVARAAARGKRVVAEPINLRQARKAKARRDKDDAAAQARERHGETKASRSAREIAAKKARKEIDAHKRERD